MALRPLLVDTREASNHPLWFEDGDWAVQTPGTMAHQGFIPEQKTLKYGDFVVPLEAPHYALPQLVVESKTWEDLISSVRDQGAGRVDSRIRHQLKGLLAIKEVGAQPAIMTVGTMRPSDDGGVTIKNKGRARHYNWDYFELVGSLLAIQHMGVMWIPAPTEIEVPRTLRIATDIVERLEHFPQPGLPRIGALSPRMDDFATTMTAVQGLGKVVAMTMAAHFDNFPAFYEADIDTIKKVPGIGPIMASRIHAHFHGMESMSPLSLDEIEEELMST